MPVEEFLRLILEKGSALGVFGLSPGLAKAQAEGVNAYARVLLDWYTHGKRFLHAMGEDEAPTESLQLEALKTCTDSQLRRHIEEALIAK